MMLTAETDDVLRMVQYYIKDYTDIIGKRIVIYGAGTVGKSYYTQLVLVSVNDNLIYCDPKHCSQHNNVIQCGHCLTSLPLVDGLRCCESEDLLQISYCHARILSQSCDVYSRCGHINDRDNVHFIYSPIPVWDFSRLYPNNKNTACLI